MSWTQDLPWAHSMHYCCGEQTSSRSYKCLCVHIEPGLELSILVCLSHHSLGGATSHQELERTCERVVAELCFGQIFAGASESHLRTGLQAAVAGCLRENGADLVQNPSTGVTTITLVTADCERLCVCHGVEAARGDGVCVTGVTQAGACTTLLTLGADRAAGQTRAPMFGSCRLDAQQWLCLVTEPSLQERLISDSHTCCRVAELMSKRRAALSDHDVVSGRREVDGMGANATCNHSFPVLIVDTRAIAESVNRTIESVSTHNDVQSDSKGSSKKASRNNSKDNSKNEGNKQRIKAYVDFDEIKHLLDS